MHTIIQLRPFSIDDVSIIKVSSSILPIVKPTDDFNSFDYIDVVKDNTGKFSFLPNKLITNLFVLFIDDNTPVGYLNQLFDFTYVKEIYFFLKELEVSIDKIISIYIPEIYAQHSEQSPAVHPNFYSKVSNQNEVSEQLSSYNTLQESYLQNPEIGLIGDLSSVYQFENYQRVSTQQTNTSTNYYKAVAFLSTTILSTELSITLENPRIGSDLIRGSYLVFRPTETQIVILFPISRSNQYPDCAVVNLTDPIPTDSQIFLDFNNLWTIVNGSRYYIIYNTIEDPFIIDGWAVSVKNGEIQKSVKTTYLSTNFSYLGNIIFDTSTQSLCDAISLTEGTIEEVVSYPHTFFGLNKDLRDRVNEIWTSCIDSYSLNSKFSNKFILSNRYCLFFYQDLTTAVVISNFPTTTKRDRMILTLNKDIRLNNHLAFTQNQVLNLVSLDRSTNNFIDQNNGTSLFIVSGRYVLC